MAKFIHLKESDPLSKSLKSGTVISMTDGWRGRVHHDNGECVSLIADGEEMNKSFKGHRGFMRRSMKIGSFRMSGRSQVVDLATRKILRGVSIVDRARLEAEWESAPGYH